MKTKIIYWIMKAKNCRNTFKVAIFHYIKNLRNKTMLSLGGFSGRPLKDWTLDD
jgi:hypothetical protein